jgi:hypothetical protein
LEILIATEPVPQTLLVWVKRNTVNNVRNVLTFKHLSKRELEGWREQRRSYPAGRGWRIT